MEKLSVVLLVKREKSLKGMAILKKMLLCFTVLFLALSSLQFSFHGFPEKSLNGYFRLKPVPELKFFTWRRWFSGEFQEKTTANLEDHTGFRNSLFRIHNDYDYRLFGITHTEGFIRGKGGNLFEEDYILEYTGKYFIGKKSWDYKLRKLQAVQQKLHSAGTYLILVVEPGKASYYSELIPYRYLRNGKTLSNYTYLTSWLDSRKIPYLNLNKWFLELKDTCRYPLFPEYGMHWSLYSVPLVVDTLAGYIETVTNRKLPRFTTGRVVLSDSLRWTDKDIADLLNLVIPLRGSKMAYQEVTIGKEHAEPTLKVLTIADSYYLNVINDYSGKVFESEEYWYYNSKLYPHIIDDRDLVHVDKSDLLNKLTGFDVILLMVSEINLHCGFWNFADEAYQAFFPGFSDPPWYPYENRIRNERGWLRFLVKKAEMNGISLESQIERDAKYLYNLENH
ncbi:MAG: hypothetical protein V1733_03820 [bacterium]